MVERKPIPGFDGYFVSPDGRIWSDHRHQYTYGTKRPDGYMQARFHAKGYDKVRFVHRLVAEAFIPNPDNLPEVNHKDENKQNNDASNLEWCDSTYNNRYGTRCKRVSDAQSKSVLRIFPNGAIQIYSGMLDAEQKTGIWERNISAVCRGTRSIAGGSRWMDIDKQIVKEAMPMRVFNEHGQPEYRDYIPGEILPPGWSVMPFFPGYTFENGISTYWGEEVGEGGYVYAEPGIWTNVAVLDSASHHPSSLIAENLFGDEFTKRFHDILKTRILIKHKQFNEAKKLFDGKLAPYLTDEKQAKQLSKALKIAINSVYGLTSAGFENPFRDPRNVDNIVAKRGALFMVNLKHAVQDRGYSVAHIKTDSIKIPNADKDIIQFVMDYSKEYGYSFEHESTYEKMCLVNDAVYIARYTEPEECEHYYGYIPGNNADAIKDHPETRRWTATGTQFAVPYVFKTLFSHEPIDFKDMCETKSVTSALYLDMEDGKDYRFVGRVGLFCPMKVGYGGTLYRQTENKKTGQKGWANATGTKGWKWLEAEDVKEQHLEEFIDRGYYRKLVDDARASIANYGDIERFLSDEPYGVKLTDMH